MRPYFTSSSKTHALIFLDEGRLFRNRCRVTVDFYQKYLELRAGSCKSEKTSKPIRN